MNLGLGHVVMTRTVADIVSINTHFSKEVLSSLERHSTGDWGEISKESKAENDKAVKVNERILSVYNTSQGKIWIITEWDRSATTILFPSEY